VWTGFGAYGWRKAGLEDGKFGSWGLEFRVRVGTRVLAVSVEACRGFGFVGGMVGRRARSSCSFLADLALAHLLNCVNCFRRVPFSAQRRLRVPFRFWGEGPWTAESTLPEF
jgi:hypothetical protein